MSLPGKVCCEDIVLLRPIEPLCQQAPLCVWVQSFRRGPPAPACFARAAAKSSSDGAARCASSVVSDERALLAALRHCAFSVAEATACAISPAVSLNLSEN